MGTLAEGLAAEAAAREPGFVALLWVTAAGKALLGVVALALIRMPRAPGRAPRSRRVLRAAAAIAGVALLLYGTANLIDFALMAAGARDVPAAVGDHAVTWYLVLWEPLWILGGALFLAAARSAPMHPPSPTLRRRARHPPSDEHRHPRPMSTDTPVR